jgi:hypothetical protein
VAKDTKFLTVDWPIWLRELRTFPAEQRAELLDLAADYVSTMTAERRSDVAPGLRAACIVAARRDLEATLAAADYVATGGMAGALLAASDALDVSSTGLLSADFSATPFLAVVETATASGSSVEMAGRVHDVLERLASAGPDLTVRVSGRFGGGLLDVVGTAVPVDGGLHFRATIDLAAIGRGLHPGVGHELRLDLLLQANDDGAIAQRPLTARDAALPMQPLPLPNRWHRLLGAEALLIERNGRLVLALPALRPSADGVLDLASRARLLARRRLRHGARPQH